MSCENNSIQLYISSHFISILYWCSIKSMLFHWIIQIFIILITKTQRSSAPNIEWWFTYYLEQLFEFGFKVIFCVWILNQTYLSDFVVIDLIWFDQNLEFKFDFHHDDEMFYNMNPLMLMVSTWFGSDLIWLD